MAALLVGIVEAKGGNPYRKTGTSVGYEIAVPLIRDLLICGLVVINEEITNHKIFTVKNRTNLKRDSLEVGTGNG